MERLDPRSVWLFFIKLILRWLVLVVTLGVCFLIFLPVFQTKFSFGFFNWLWLILLALLIFSFIWARLTYHFYSYKLTDAGFYKESGVIYKKYTTIPYDRIQNVDIRRGLLARIFGLSDLNIQTAGASAVISRSGTIDLGAEGHLPGLSREVAEQLRDELIRRAN